MKIIHLSDIHIGHENNHILLNLLLDDIQIHEQKEQSIVVITGDLINQGTADERKLGLDILDRFTQTGWRVLLAPGNHDCGNAAKVDPQQAAAFMQAFSKYIFRDRAAIFPVVHIISDCAFIGLDSNQGEMGWWARWFAEGNLGDPQLDALNAILDLPELKNKTKVIYLHHHAFFDAFMVRSDIDDQHYVSQLISWNTRRFRRLKDAYSLMLILRDRADILLFGHQHFGYDYSAEGQRYGLSLALDGSSSTCTDMQGDRMRYRIINTDTLTATTRMVLLPEKNRSL